MRIVAIVLLLIGPLAACRSVDQPPDIDACEHYIAQRLADPEDLEIVSLETTEEWEATLEELQRYYPAGGAEWRRSGLADAAEPLTVRRYTINWAAENAVGSAIDGRTQCLILWENGRPLDENGLVDLAGLFSQRRELINGDTIELVSSDEQHDELPCCLPGL